MSRRTAGKRPPHPRALGVLLLACLLLACHLLACRGGDGERMLRPLSDPAHVPDVLFEDSALALRPTQDGNRFLAGWWPLRRGGDLALAPAEGGGRLELVHLAERPRRLALDLVDASYTPGSEVRVRVAGRDLGAVPLSDPIEVPLPADLPRGRLLVELTPGETPFEVREGRVRPALPAGEVRWEDGGLLQSGVSRVDFVRLVGAGETLVGRFSAPADARPEQRFLIHVEHRSGASSTPFSWAPGDADGRFDVPLKTTGFVRLSFEAQGSGPPGRWSGLALASIPAAASEPPPRPAPQVEPPGVVVLYVMDALRAGTVSHLGGLPGTTPVLDRLAREGVTFRRHRSTAPNTLPSTKALLTGVARGDRGGWKLSPDGAVTLAERFRGAGYRTGLFSGNAWVGPAYGVDRGFEHVTEAPVEEGRAPYNDNAERLHRAALGWLRELPAGDRAFLYIHAIHPHNPYDPPEPWRSELTRDISSSVDGSTRTLLAIQRRRLEVDDAGRERLRRLYAAGLAYNDAQLGSFLAEVRRLFPDRSLFVAVTSDHGEELFDHGGVLHGYTLYEEMIRVPMVVWSPGLLEPGDWTGPTSTLDLHATLAELADGAAPSDAGDGRSLLPVLLGRGSDGDSTREVHLAAAASVKGGIYSIQNARWKLVWAPRTGLDWGLGGGLGRTRSQEYLFHLEEDPGELVNRAGEGDLETAWLRSRLRAWIEAKTARGDEDAEVDVDEETRRRLEALGYVD